MVEKFVDKDPKKGNFNSRMRFCKRFNNDRKRVSAVHVVKVVGVVKVVFRYSPYEAVAELMFLLQLPLIIEDYS
jgi:hypothetical protein